MGHRFFEGTMPKIAEELQGLNTTLTTIAQELRAYNARPAPGPATTRPADTTMTWPATLARIAEHYLQIDSLEPRGADSLDLHQVGVAALGSALRAAYRAGIAASVRHSRTDAPVRGQDDAAEPR